MASTRFAEVRQSAFFNASPELVRRQFVDLEHHIRTNVHPKLSFKVLSQSATGARYVQEVTLLGIRQRDVFERQILPDGSIHDRSVEGFNKGGELRFGFAPEGAGTRVDVLIRVPLPPVVGGLIRPLLEKQVRREVQTAIEEDRYDLEVRGYPAKVKAH
ncbi:MAG TPA: SRPBCC family protein [Burkholderiaceae bacterium]|nr:SRPBCC family protein [Burkholderiaceae bacterium]